MCQTMKKREKESVSEKKQPQNGILWEREGSFFHSGPWKPEKLNQVKCPGNLGEAGLVLLNHGSRPHRGVT